MRVSRHVSAASVVFLVLTELVCTLLIREVCAETCEEIYSVERLSEGVGGDVFTNLEVLCEPPLGCSSDGDTCTGFNAYIGNVADRQCRCRCYGTHRTFNFSKCVNLQDGSLGTCMVKLPQPENEKNQVPLRRLPHSGGAIQESKLLWERNDHPITGRVTLHSAEYLGYDQGWHSLSQRVEARTSLVGGTQFFSIEHSTPDDHSYIKYYHPQAQSIANCFHGLIIKLTLEIHGQGNSNRPGCVFFKLAGKLEYYNASGILPCQELQPPATTHHTDADDTTSNAPTAVQTNAGTTSPLQHITDKISTSAMQSTSHTTSPKIGEMDEMKSSPVNIGAIVGPVCAAVVIFIVGGVFILRHRKFRPSLSKKNKNQRVTMSSLQNGHPHPTEGTVDNVIYAGDDAGIVDNVIYEGGMGADGVFSNPGYADKTPQFKPRMEVPGAFVQPNLGATNKTPQPQRNVIIEEPQYAQIVDDQYADPQKVRDRKDKKNKKKAGKDKNYADLHGPHEKQPGANNSNSNHVYQGLNKGSDYQSLRGPREHHEVRPFQVPKTPQDEHDYTSLTHGGSRPSAGTLSKEGPDYTVLEGPDSPGEETATGPDYTTLDGPDSPGDEITSGPDYTVLDGPDSPGD